jgi:hypothetical protein
MWKPTPHHPVQISDPGHPKPRDGSSYHHSFSYEDYSFLEETACKTPGSQLDDLDHRTLWALRLNPLTSALFLPLYMKRSGLWEGICKKFPQSMDGLANIHFYPPDRYVHWAADETEACTQLLSCPHLNTKLLSFLFIYFVVAVGL